MNHNRPILATFVTGNVENSLKETQSINAALKTPRIYAVRGTPCYAKPNNCAITPGERLENA
jgi:hypothetical protein